MQHQGSRTAAHNDDTTDLAVLALLHEDPQPWSTDEIAAAVGNAIAAADSIERLISSGLLHRLNAFVFPTRAARRATELYN